MQRRLRLSERKNKMTNYCERCGTTDLKEGEILCEHCIFEIECEEARLKTLASKRD